MSGQQHQLIVPKRSVLPSRRGGIEMIKQGELRFLKFLRKLNFQLLGMKMQKYVVLELVLVALVRRRILMPNGATSTSSYYAPNYFVNC
jgi:hypothetical protein